MWLFCWLEFCYFGIKGVVNLKFSGHTLIRWLFENPCFVFDDLLVGLSLYKPQVGHLQEEDPDTPIKKQKKIKATSLAISLVIP